MPKELKPQFRIRIDFHFEDHDGNRRRKFGFGSDLDRRVPVLMEGVEGYNTISMRPNQPGEFDAGESCQVDCIALCPELFQNSISIGSKGKLWEAGFFANVEVIKIYSEGWPSVV